MIAAGIDPDIVVCNNILRACSEEGAFGEAANLIDTMKASGLSPNVVSYSILVDAFCKRKELDKAFEVCTKKAPPPMLQGVYLNLYTHALQVAIKKRKVDVQIMVPGINNVPGS